MKTSVKHDIIKRWNVTGDDGTSRFSLILLRIMTTVFFIGTLGFLAIVLDVFDASNLSIKHQALHIVTGTILGFLAIPVGVAIGTHPMAKPPAKILTLAGFLGYVGYRAQLNEMFDSSGLSPFLFFPGLLMLAAALAFIPIT